MFPPEIKRILSELWVHKRRLAWVIFTGIFMAMIDTSTAHFTRAIVDRFNSGRMDLMRDSFIALIVLAFLKAPLRYSHFFIMNFSAEMVSQSLRSQLQRKFMNLNLSFHNNYLHGSGGLISRVLNDIMVIHHGLRMFADFFREPFLFIGLVSTLFYFNWKLTCYVILVLPPILWFLRQISRSLRKYGARGQEDLEQIAATIKESLDGVRIIQSFNLEKEMEKRFRNDSVQFLNSRKTFYKYLEAASPINELIVSMVILGILAFIAMEISDGKSTQGDFIGYVAALLMLSSPVKKLQESYVRIQETIVAAKRVFSLIDEKSEVEATKNPIPFPENWNQIEFKNVSFSYGSSLVLKKVSFVVKRGQTIAFVGASGSGKSTIVNLLERFFDPTEGQILIDSIPINQFDLKELRSKISLVSQDVFLFSDTIERNIWAGNFDHSSDRVVEAAKNANAHTFITKMPKAYQSRVGDRGNLLSGGEKQRISISRALFKDAPILILDEATSSLDTASEQEVQTGLDQLMEGRTTFVVAHRLATIQNADLICVVRQGEIVASGSHSELLNHSSEYSRLFSI